eukprot:CAMPEP_0168437940 /NCGR_PEP_ID=MMETSP0228-20121227/41703_1 /TAXON_ID=133427 /ORGANISM="Protoceratium reticulatum, Strain CCCM 535 (=CCMP 1889)" /LENGTH=579 /DNA_ID=CAMNT_0008452189 /DNA_START=15 /DNA_END=1754 /DNA_ORIENTATION=-
MSLRGQLVARFALSAVLLADYVDASAFLDRTVSGGPQSSWRRGILAELEGALGAEHRRATEARLGQLESMLRPTFAALPKHADGALGAPAARYALHRLFVQRHGWQVRGLEPGGESWAGASPAAALGDRVPDSVKDLFEERLGGLGLSLHELAVLAATLENLIHGEAVGRLQATYRLLEQPAQGEALPAERAAEVIDTYMAIFILGLNVTDRSSEYLRRKIGNVSRTYPGWPETQKFLRQVQSEVAPSKENYTFNGITAVVEQVGERYGRWQNSECSTLKDDLMKLEVPGTGRVRLADFYAGALHDSQWQFSESVAYLRQLGVLDESEPEALKVIIPNYITGASNCIASSTYYGVCCMDECEELFSHLERKVGAPTVDVERILALVAALPSASVPANRTLSAALAGRLRDVAAQHNGVIPLHGRLFAQWMHYAYPRECPFPHISGTTRPQRADDWVSQGGRTIHATKEEMLQHASAARGPRPRPADEETLCSDMWTLEEELVDPHAHQVHMARAELNEQGASSLVWRSVLRLLCVVAALGSFAVGMAKTLGPALATGRDPDEKAAAGPAPGAAPRVFTV